MLETTLSAQLANIITPKNFHAANAPSVDGLVTPNHSVESNPKQINQRTPTFLQTQTQTGKLVMNVEILPTSETSVQR
jgi:hypothetical protein